MDHKKEIESYIESLRSFVEFISNQTSIDYHDYDTFLDDIEVDLKAFYSLVEFLKEKLYVKIKYIEGKYYFQFKVGGNKYRVELEELEEETQDILDEIFYIDNIKKDN